MVAPSNTFPFYQTFREFFPNFPESRNVSENFTLPQDRFQSARENLERCFDDCELVSVVKLCDSLLPLTYAQLEAIDKIRCDLFRKKDHELQDLKQEVRKLAIMPWHEKYRWSWPFVASGALLGIFWVCMTPGTIRSLTGTASLSSLLFGAYKSAEVCLYDNHKEINLKATTLNFAIVGEINRFVVEIIDRNEQDKIRTLEIPILSIDTRAIQQRSSQEFIEKTEETSLAKTTEETDDLAGPSGLTSVVYDNFSILSQKIECKIQSQLSEVEILKQQIAKMERQALIDKNEKQCLRDEVQQERDGKLHYKNKLQLEKNEKQQVFSGLENHGIFVKVSRRNAS